MAILGIYVRFLGCTWALGRRHWAFWNLCESHLGHFDYFWYLVAHGRYRNLQSGGRWVRTHTCLGDFFQPTYRSEVCSYNLQPNLPTIFPTKSFASLFWKLLLRSLLWPLGCHQANQFIATQTPAGNGTVTRKWWWKVRESPQNDRNIQVKDL